MRFRIDVLIFLVIGISGCSGIPEPKDVPLIDGLPTMEQLAERLNEAGAKSAKWAVMDSTIVYSSVQAVDWKKEFEAFMRDNVNHLRFREAYAVTDTLIGSERIVVFTAREASQEIRSMEVHTKDGRIRYYRVHKSRKNLLAESSQTFVFSGTSYTIHIVQSIRWLFSNEQFVHGTVIERGDLWRATLDLGDKHMPVQIVLDTAGHHPTLHVKNGEELIGFTKFRLEKDSLVFESDYFNSCFKLKLTSDSTMAGAWVNAKKDRIAVLPLVAKKNVPYRFTSTRVPSLQLSGLHTAVFYNPDGSVDDSTLLRIDQSRHMVTGSFLTETGDYRFLEGVVRNDSLFMSALDGAHAYYFEAGMENGVLKGTYWSGNQWKQPWLAYPFQSFRMRDPESITQLVADSVFDFSFEDHNGRVVSLSDPAFEHNVLLVSIMGTWCSNCLDEALFLKEAYDLYHDKGLNVVALDFELVSDSARARQNINRHRESLGIEYPVLLASVSNTREKAARALPSLNGIFSYPTLIVLDRKHEVVRIHTGFSGPATGKDGYERFREEYLGLIDSLVKTHP